MKNLHAENETLEAKYNPELGAVVNTFPNKILTPEFIFKCNSALEKLLEHQCTKLIVDTSDLGVMGNDKQAFIKQEWFPRAMDSGLKRMAFIVPKDVFGKFGIEKANEEAENSPIEMKYFSSIEEAKEWIKN